MSRVLFVVLAAFSLPLAGCAGARRHEAATAPQAGTLHASQESAPDSAPDSASVVALLGGVANVACPLAGVATGGQPDAAHVAALARAGFTTVLDLRAADEARGFDEVAAVRAAGVEYVALPITSSTLDDGAFDAFRAAMRKRDGKGVFVHCASGNRVGAAMIPWLVLDRGWTLERAVTSARAGGLRSDELEERARDYVMRNGSQH